MDYLKILDKLEKFKADMSFHEHLNIKTTDLTKTIDHKFDLDCMEDRKKHITELQNILKLFYDEFQKTTEKSFKKALYFTFREYKENLIKKCSEIVRKKRQIMTQL